MTFCHSEGLFPRNSSERDDAADLVSRYLWSDAAAQCHRQNADKPNQRNIATHEMTRKKSRNSVYDGAHNSGKTSASRIEGHSLTRGAGQPPSHALMDLVRAVAKGDAATALRLLALSPTLASARLKDGATRQTARPYLDEIEHYLYAGDTALHVAAAAYQGEIARELIAAGADVRARNRRGAEPLHYAADGVPGSGAFNPPAQALTVACLIAAAADPNALDKNGATPLHRAVRTRCAGAVRALLDGGADPERKNKNGSTPIELATRNTGRGGSGSLDAKAQQEQIVRLFGQHRPPK
jgi:hypothetical protein